MTGLIALFHSCPPDGPLRWILQIMEALYTWMADRGLDPAMLPWIGAAALLVLVVVVVLIGKRCRQRRQQQRQLEARRRGEQERADAAEVAQRQKVEQQAPEERAPEEQARRVEAQAVAIERERTEPPQAQAEQAEKLRVGEEEAEAAAPAAEQAEAEQAAAEEARRAQNDAARQAQEALRQKEAEAAARQAEEGALKAAEAAELERRAAAERAAQAEKQAEEERRVAAAEKAEQERQQAAEAARAAAERPPEQHEQPPEQQKKRLLDRIKSGLSRTRANLTGQLGDLFLGAKEIDEELLEEIETTLLMADIGVEATTEIIQRLTERVERKQLKDADALRDALKQALAELLASVEQPLQLPEKKPAVILVVGVNGVGKTTTIGKLAKKFQSEGRSVMLAAGDTFRAAAVEQLQVWGERNNVPVVAQHTGADSASVIFDALQSAQAKGIDLLIADTAGRLQNKENLMQELQKVVRVMRKLDPDAPDEVMLVLDAGTGQNAISQAKQFKEAVGVTGITLTKLDGTAKGGIIFAIAKQFGLPIRFIGVGEQVDDLRPFTADDFVQALFD
jgi:fused signal recognition particle receptor